MPYRGVIAADEPARVGSATLWIGALSFEERCAASLARLSQAGFAPAHVLLFEYPTDVRPVAQDRERRRRNRSKIAALRSNSDSVSTEFSELDPYSYRAAQGAVTDAMERFSPKYVVLDVSCLTKIHAIALAAPTLFAATTDWQLAYTVPETYGHLDTPNDGRSGWRDVLVLPVGTPDGLAHETQARGVILAGHEADRLVIALAETEPAAGVIVTATTDRRPDLRRESERRNAKIMRLLVGRGDGCWVHQAIGLQNPAALNGAVGAQISSALKEDAPVLLYPFGPKPFVALAAMQMSATTALQGWLVYPIPSSYDVDYSYGIGKTFWYGCPQRPMEDEQQRLPIVPGGD